MTKFSGMYGKKDSMNRGIKSKTLSISWGKIGRRFSNQVEIRWSGKTVEKLKRE